MCTRAIMSPYIIGLGASLQETPWLIILRHKQQGDEVPSHQTTKWWWSLSPWFGKSFCAVTSASPRPPLLFHFLWLALLNIPLWIIPQHTHSQMKMRFCDHHWSALLKASGGFLKPSAVAIFCRKTWLMVFLNLYSTRKELWRCCQTSIFKKKVRFRNSLGKSGPYASYAPRTCNAMEGLHWLFWQFWPHCDLLLSARREIDHIWG